jgi:Holliday junction resolvase
MRERDIEKYLVTQVRKLGGKAYKWSSPSHRGVPDRLVFLPHGIVLAVELKAQGKKPTKLQHYSHEELRSLGAEVLVVDSKAKVDALLRNFK